MWWGSGNNYQIQADTFIYGTVNQIWSDPVYNYVVWSYAVGYDSCNGQPWQQTTIPGSAAASYASQVRAYSGGSQNTCSASHQYREYSQHERRFTSGDGWVGTYAYTYH
ncbi:MAG: hypothetical protein IT304_05195 [Dehalococcoidia bacterium]|nr:hypothetical protein [Dehalococcoidia bacterium]